MLALTAGLQRLVNVRISFVNHRSVQKEWDATPRKQQRLLPINLRALLLLRRLWPRCSVQPVPPPHAVAAAVLGCVP